MDTLSYKTISANKATVEAEWLLVDATGLPIGRLCSEIAKLLRGKHKPSFTPHVDCGDNVVVINADKAIMTGKKWTDRVYVRYTRYPGGQRFSTPKREFEKGGADRLVRRMVAGMLPKNRLGKTLIDHLYIYGGEEHDKAAQKPREIEFPNLK